MYSTSRVYLRGSTSAAPLISCLKLDRRRWTHTISTPSAKLRGSIEFKQMSVVIVTGSAGLIGSEASKWFHQQGFDIAGIDNDLRAWFFGSKASNSLNRIALETSLGRYTHYSIDIRNVDALRTIFRQFGREVKAVIHTAAQPSHDWAARDPQADFGVNALGTLNLLECTREFSPEAVFLFTSTNKVYGDNPNRLPLVELATRWEIEDSHPYFKGIDEQMSLDQTTHSLFGVSKVSADLLVQEYGRYFGMYTACFRGGCLTGPAHSGTELHGFLAFLMKCTVTGEPYQIFGYKGKQVRDNIHSYDFIQALWEFFQAPRRGEVYNMGGSRHSNCSMLEAVELCEKIAGRKLAWDYTETNRKGDHMWYISDVRRFQEHYPSWKYEYGLKKILSEIYAACLDRDQAQRQ
jgi:CDP-paratose 2-epimerase